MANSRPRRSCNRLLAKNLRQAGWLLTLGIVGVVICVLDFDSDTEELGQSVIGLALLLAAAAAVVRGTMHLFSSTEFREKYAGNEGQNTNLENEAKVERKFGLSIAAVLVAMVFGNIVADGGVLPLTQRYSNYSYDDAGAAGAEAEETADAVMGATAEEAALAGEAEPLFPVSEYAIQILLPNSPIGGATMDIPDPGLADRRNPSLQYRTSFNCEKVSTFVEMTICSDQSLAAQDVELSANFTKRLARLKGSARAEFLSIQRQSLADSGRCSTQYCIQTWYSNALSIAKKADAANLLIDSLETAPLEDGTEIEEAGTTK